MLAGRLRPIAAPTTSTTPNDPNAIAAEAAHAATTEGPANDLDVAERPDLNGTNPPA